MKRILIGALMLLLVPLGRAAENGLLAHWELSPDRSQNSGIRAVVGGAELSLSGPLRLVKDPGPPRVELPGRDERIEVAAKLDKTMLPELGITLETWVRVDKTSPSGGIFSFLEENGEQSRGWLLGFTNDHFLLGLSTESTKRFTHLRAAQAFETNRWYHLVASYDGSEQAIYINGESAATSREQSGAILYPSKASCLIGSFERAGLRDSLSGAIHEARIYRRALSSAEIRQKFQERRAQFPEPAPTPILFRPDYGPFVDWRDRRSAWVTWETVEEVPTRLRLELPGGGSEVLGDGQARKQHSVLLNALETDREYHYRLLAPEIAGRPVFSSRYFFDTSFYYRVPSAPVREAGAAEVGLVADRILQQSGVRDGYCLVLGAEDGRLALEIVRRSQLQVIVVEADPRRVAAVRKLFDEAGVEGVRASVHQQSGAELPYGDLFANLILSESALATGAVLPFSAAEVHRLLRPVGGTLLVGGPKVDLPRWRTWLAGSALSEASLEEEGGSWLKFRRPKLTGAGEWGHQYGGPDNSSCSQDELVQGDLEVAWWGDPGPRPMPDRGNRNPAPLSVNGRLFVQGNRILFGIDAYNGTILWNVSTPEVRRANVTRDCSNMAANGDTLYVAHGRYCLAVEGQTGARRRRFEVPTAVGEGVRDWGYVAAGETILLGSRVKREATYLGDDGEWYEEYAPDQVSRVTSDLLFALDPRDGKPIWEYRGGAILNSTLTLGDGTLYFIESRNPAALQAPGSRLTNEELLDQHLVALDLHTGKKVWEKAHDFSSCQFMTYLVYGKHTVVVTGTDREKNYHTFAFSAPPAYRPLLGGESADAAPGGRLLWTDVHHEDKGHHSGHLQHPVVIDNVFYSDQRSFDLTTGETLRRDLPERRGCGVMSSGSKAIFYRHHFQSMWDLATNKRKQFEGIRSGCWLGLIPAGGFLLAPETSAGCSCTHAIQTSVGYIPKSLTLHRPASLP